MLVSKTHHNCEGPILWSERWAYKKIVMPYELRKLKEKYLINYL